MTSASASPQELQNLLLLLQYGKRFPDYPQNFNWSIVFDTTREKPFNHNGIVPSAIVTIILSSIVVIARLSVRVYRREWGWDDWLMAATLFFAIGWGVLQIVFVTVGGIGHHIYDLPYQQLQLLVQITHWDLSLYIVMAQLLRTSIFFHLRRIVPKKARVTHRIIMFTLVFQIVFACAAFLLNHVSCRNPAALWSLDVRIRDFRCVDWTKLILGISVVFTASDIWTFCVPMRIIWGLQLPKRSQIAAVFVFIIGGFAIASSLARLFYIAPSYNSWDSTWNGNGAILWLQFEGTFGMIAACLPVFNIFPTRYIPDWVKDSRLSPALKELLGSKESLNEVYVAKPPVPKLVPGGYSPRQSTVAEKAYIPYDTDSMRKSDFITGHDFFTDSESRKSSDEPLANEEKLYARYYSQTRHTQSSSAMVDRSVASRSWPATRGAVRTQHPYFAESSTEHDDEDSTSVHSVETSKSRGSGNSVWVLQKP